MIKVNINVEGVDERGVIVNNDVEVNGTKNVVKYEIAGLLKCLYNIDDGETLCASMDLLLAKLLSLKA